jgi:N6-adenosine-specific RNA methylase IME4
MTPEDAEEYTQSLGQIGGGLWRQILWAQRNGVPAILGLSLREWVDDRLGGYVRMAIEERRQAVAELHAEGLTQRETADVLGVDQATVHRDLKPDDANASEPEPELVLGTMSPQDPDANASEPEPEPVELPADRADEIAELAAQAPPPEPVDDPPPLPDETFACIVIDPPWPVSKIKRKARPWQGEALDYPVMTVPDIEALPVGDLAAGDAHLYLWVTHRHLPDGLRLLAAWGFRYQCQMTWVKNTGMVPYSWMYDTEHVLFATRGNLPVAKKGLRLSFDEPVNGHSAKPAVFYERVRLASPGPRLEMFARQARDGFTAWGNEVT